MDGIEGGQGDPLMVGQSGWAGDSHTAGIERKGELGESLIEDRKRAKIYHHSIFYGAGRVWRGRNGRNISETHQHFGDCGISEGSGTDLTRSLSAGGSG